MRFNGLLDERAGAEDPTETQSRQRVALAQRVRHDGLRVQRGQIDRVVDEGLFAINLVVNQPNRFAAAALQRVDEQLRLIAT